MVERRSGESAVDLSECLFARFPATAQGYDTVTMRVPVVGTRGDEPIALVGEEARAMITKFHLASACGILVAIGQPKIAALVEGAYLQMEAMKDV